MIPILIIIVLVLVLLPKRQSRQRLELSPGMAVYSLRSGQAKDYQGMIINRLIVDGSYFGNGAWFAFTVPRNALLLVTSVPGDPPGPAPDSPPYCVRIVA